MKTLKEGDKFRSKWFDYLITVKKVDANANRLTVEIDKGDGVNKWEEDKWNLQHVLWGFENGDYYEKVSV